MLSCARGRVGAVAQVLTVLCLLVVVACCSAAATHATTSPSSSSSLSSSSSSSSVQGDWRNAAADAEQRLASSWRAATQHRSKLDSATQQQHEQQQQQQQEHNADQLSCSGTARIAETIPSNLTLHTDLSTGDAWLQLINNATQTLDLAVFYMTLLNGTDIGQKVFNALVAACDRNVAINVAISAPNAQFPDDDLVTLQQQCGSQISVAYLNMSTFFDGGVLHTKFIIADGQAFYIGSANMDWRSLSEVKELGIVVDKCNLLASDLKKVFDVFVLASNLERLPAFWPSQLDTDFNASNPATIAVNHESGSAFISSSPHAFCPAGRSFDRDALEFAILSAQTNVSIEVMDYLPITVYEEPQVYWPALDTAIRTVAFNKKVQVNMLIAYWDNSIEGMIPFLKSLNDLDNVEVRLMEIPKNTPYVPFTRVNHAKFIVTDSLVAISTSNYVGDYFINTAGSSLVTDAKSLVSSVQSRFDRDWASQYSVPLSSV
ncbi:phospholipase D3 [Capsaspora owczarzaki ATCC 30864]|uniref:Phospholipase D3 n=2 Tax=Capsaspora owczarzaki (strain ATCC 30864) TaxID=595528 RepID=A0A0D2ULN3_CAPO3|nr:phospholipase D3 [Capsaspora owczarzaki ATCC 30864]